MCNQTFLFRLGAVIHSMALLIYGPLVFKSSVNYETRDLRVLMELLSISVVAQLTADNCRIKLIYGFRHLRFY